MMARNRPNYSHTKPPRKNKLLISVFIGLIATICLVAGFTAGLRSLVQGPEFKNYLTSRIQRSLACAVSMDHLSFRWTSLTSALVESREIKIGNITTDPFELSIARLEMSLDLGGMLSGALDVDFLNISNPRITIDSNSVTSIVPKLSTGPGFRPALNPIVKSLRIIDAKVLNRKKSGANIQLETLFSGIECSAGNISMTGVERFEAHGLSHEGNKKGRLELSGNVELSGDTDESYSRKSFIKFRLLDYPIYPVSHIMSGFFPNLASLRGVANANIQVNGSWDAWKLVGTLEINNFSQSTNRHSVGAHSDRISTSIEGYRNADRISISMPSLSAPGIDASVETNFHNLGSENAHVAVSVRKADINLDEAIRVAPLKLLDPLDQERILNAGIKGKIRILSASWNHGLKSQKKSQPFWTNLVVDASLSRVTALIPGFEIPFENTSGSFRLNSNEALFKGINVTIGSSPIVMNGWLSNLATKPKMDLFVSMKAQASDLVRLISSNAWGGKFDPYLKWIQDPGGTLSVTMDLKGDIEKPSMKGQIDIDDFNFKTENIALPFRKISGSLRFRPSSVSTAGIKGFVGESPFELKGTLSDKESQANLDMKINSSDLRKLNFIGPGWSLAGSAPLNINMKGRLPEVNFTGNLDFKTLVIIKDAWVRKPAGVALNFEFSGFKNAEGFTVDDAYLVSDASRISTRAQLREDGKFFASMNLPPKGIPTSDLTWMVDPALELQPGGRIEGDVILKKDKNQDSEVDANFSLNHVSLRLPRARKRTEGITGALQFKGKTLQINVERSRTGSSIISADIFITDFSHPRFRAGFDCEFLDTTDFTDQSGQTPVMSWIDWIRANSVIQFLNQSRGNISLKVAKGKTAYRTFSDFRSDFEGANGMLTVPKWQMNFADGTLRGTASLDLRPSTTRPLKIEFQGDQLNFDRIFVSDPNRVKLDGEVVSQGYMEWRIRSGLENGGLYKTGNMEVRVTNGTIYRFEILSKIFSLINLGSILRGRLPDMIGQGLAFQRMNWKMDIFDNKWKIKDLKFYSDAAQITASGMYFSDQGRVDFKVDVAPLVGFDTILSGLFGNLITRDGKILNTTFRVRGLSNSPDVRLEPFENLKQELKPGG